jgi:probable phosphoglycerate mutase
VKSLAERLETLPLRAIYTSPLERAFETAEAIGKSHGLAPSPDDDLGEYRIGDWQGHPIAELALRDEFRRFNTFRSGTRPPGGEMAFETQARVVRKIHELAARHRDQTVAIVSHGDPLRLAIAYFMGIAIDMLLRFEIHPASLSVLELDDQGAKVLCVNDRGGELKWAER